MNLIKMKNAQKRKQRKQNLDGEREQTNQVAPNNANTMKKQNKRKHDDKTDSPNKSKKLKLEKSDNISAKEKSMKKQKAKKRQKLRKIKWDISTKTQDSSGIVKDGQTENTMKKKQSLQSDKDTSDAKSKTHKKKFNKSRSENNPVKAAMKVHTHAALYRNPQEFSSNWKKLMKEINVGEKKEQPKRKANSHKSSQPVKKRKKNENGQHVADKIISSPTVEKPEIWFDDVEEYLLDTDVKETTEDKTGRHKSVHPDTNEDPKEDDGQKEETANPLVKERAFEGLTKAVAMDCEMVGVGKGGKDSVLARVSIVNHFGKCIYDKYVKPREHVTDFRTQFSGIRPEDLKTAEDFRVVQKDVYEIIKGRILVGHALHNDLKVLYLDHPRKKIRDTARYRAFRKIFQGKTPSLKKLTEKVLSVNVQKGEHNSVEDAQAAMRLYTMYKPQWEKEIKLKYQKTKLVKPTVVTEIDS